MHRSGPSGRETRLTINGQYLAGASESQLLERLRQMRHCPKASRENSDRQAVVTETESSLKWTRDLGPLVKV